MRDLSGRFHVQPGGGIKRVHGALGGECSGGHDRSDAVHQRRLLVEKRTQLSEGLEEATGCLAQLGLDELSEDADWAPDSSIRVAAEEDRQPPIPMDRRYDMFEALDFDYELRSVIGPRDNEHLHPVTAHRVKAAWLAGANSFYTDSDQDAYSMAEIFDLGDWPLHVNFSGPMDDVPEDEEQLWWEAAIDDPPEEDNWAVHPFYIWDELRHQFWARWFADRHTHRENQFVEQQMRVKRHRGRFGSDQHSEPDSASVASRRAKQERMAAADIRDGLREFYAAQGRGARTSEPAPFVSQELSVELPNSGSVTVATRRRWVVTTHTRDGQIMSAHAGGRPRRSHRR